MSGYASYDEAHDAKYGSPHKVPIVIGNKASLQGYGRLVHDFDEEVVEITTWPQLGRRPIHPGTGNQGGVTSGDFIYTWKGDQLTAQNQAVGGDYVTGRLPPGGSVSNRQCVLTREANYHPDGGQVFFPKDGAAFVLLLALPGDDVKLEDFVAFYFDGSCGVQIHANIWHQPAFPISDRAAFRGKQGKVHACVCMDSVNEFGKFLLVPLTPNYHV